LSPLNSFTRGERERETKESQEENKTQAGEDDATTKERMLARLRKKRRQKRDEK
jgi:hypothetical protein